MIEFVGGLRKLGAIGAFLFANLAMLTVQAEPVTFAFTAEVTDVDELSPAVLPFTVQTGDSIQGRFTFEPVDAQSSMEATDTTQNLGVRFQLDSTVLTSVDYFLLVRNDSPMIDAPEITTDDIWLGCTSVGASSCHPNTVPSMNGSIWWFSLPLLGNGSVLDGADIPSDPSVWQNLTPAYLSLTFQEQGIADVLRITARVDGFTAVPEPSSGMIGLVSILAVSHVASSRCCRRH